MQSCGRLIKYIYGLSGALSAKLCGKLDTLCLTTGQGSGSSGQRQIFQSYIHQESHSGADLLQDSLSDELLLFRQYHGI